MITSVVPVFDEAESLVLLHQELSAVAVKHRYDMQIIFVDDGSTDGSWAVIRQLAADDRRVLGIRFRRNFGKAAALSAGFNAADGENVVTLDGDLQDDPAEIPRLLAALDEGYDVVSGWKRTRHDPWHKRYPSRLFNWLLSSLTGVRLHDHNCGLKAFKRHVLHEIRLYGELHRFVPVLAAARGFRATEVIVNHRPRRHGKSKYGPGRILKGFLDILTVKFLTGFGHRPQHLLGTVGLASFLLGVFGLTYLAARWGVSRIFEGYEPVHLHQMASLYYSIALLVIGAQFLSIGLLGEMMTAFLTRDADAYSIAEHTSPERAAHLPTSTTSEPT